MDYCTAQTLDRIAWRAGRRSSIRYYAVAHLIAAILAGACYAPQVEALEAKQPVVLQPPPGSVGASGQAINDRGEVAGFGRNDVLNTRVATVWDRSGTPRALPFAQEEISPDQRISEMAVGITFRGEVAGTSVDEDFPEGPLSRAVLWDRRGNPTLLPPLPGATQSSAADLALVRPKRGPGAHSALLSGLHPTFASVVVVGSSWGGDEAKTAVTWDHRGNPTALLPLPGDTESEAAAINARGETVGTSSGDVATAVIWDRHGTPTALPPLVPGDDTFAADVALVWHTRRVEPGLGSLDEPRPVFASIIRPRTMVVGWSEDNDGRRTAVVWDDGDPKVLAPLPGDAGSEAAAINARGKIVGTSIGDASTAVMWHRHGSPTALPPPPPPATDDTRAFAINVRGEVAGDSLTPDLGRVQAVVWR